MSGQAVCDRCDGAPGSSATYAGQVCMPLNGRVQGIDYCIHKIVAALNAGGVRTVASCCGHGKMKGNIILEDGRMLTIQPTPEKIVGEPLNPCDRLPSSEHSR